VLCATQLLGTCATTPTTSYPRFTSAPMPKMARQATMPNPCAGVPANAFCAARRTARRVVPKFVG